MFFIDIQNEPVIAIVASTIIFFILIGFSISQLMLFKKKRQQHLFELQQLQMRYKQALLQAQLEIQEQTFRNISQEIHDNIGQILSLAKLNLYTLDLKKENLAIQKIADAKELVSKAIQDLRDLSRTLNTDTIAAAGLTRSIQQELQLLQKAGTIETHFELTGEEVKLDPQKQLILFRIVQEALHNIIKHAQAAAIHVKADFQPQYFLLSIIDDGEGFEQSNNNLYGSGLQNMRSRSEIIGATFNVISQPGSGTAITIHLPLSIIYGHHSPD